MDVQVSGLCTAINPSARYRGGGINVDEFDEDDVDAVGDVVVDLEVAAAAIGGPDVPRLGPLFPVPMPLVVIAVVTKALMPRKGRMANVK